MTEFIQSETTSVIELKEELLKHLERSDKISLLRLIQSENPGDIAEALDQIGMDQTAEIFRILLLGDVAMCGEVMVSLEPSTLARLYFRLTLQEWAWIFTELSDDDVVYLLELFPEEAQNQLVARLPTEDKEDILELMTFPEDTAGRIMTNEFLAMDENATVAAATEKIHKIKDLDPTNLFFVYVTKNNRLVGEVSLRQLLLSQDKVKLKDIMRRDVNAIDPNLDQEEVAELVRRHDEVTVPVVDPKGEILGIITVDDVIDVIDEESEEDLYKIIGTSDEELLVGDSTRKIVMLRLPWIFAAFCGSLLVAYIMKMSEQGDYFAEAASIFVYVPVICAMGGNVGVQSATIMARFLSTAEPDWTEARRTTFREARVGLSLGLICGLSVGAFAYFWVGLGMMITVSTAMICAMTSAATTGTIIPIVMKRLGFDPALATGPFVTSFNDVLATCVYFVIALALL